MHHRRAGQSLIAELRSDAVIRCPIDLDTPPCPLRGGAMPRLEWGTPAGPYSGADVLPIVPGPDASSHQFGTCAECNGLIMCDRDGVPTRVRPA